MERVVKGDGSAFAIYAMEEPTSWWREIGDRETDTIALRLSERRTLSGVEAGMKAFVTCPYPPARRVPFCRWLKKGQIGASSW